MAVLEVVLPGLCSDEPEGLQGWHLLVVWLLAYTRKTSFGCWLSGQIVSQVGSCERDERGK